MKIEDMLKNRSSRIKPYDCIGKSTIVKVKYFGTEESEIEYVTGIIRSFSKKSIILDINGGSVSFPAIYDILIPIHELHTINVVIPDEFNSKTVDYYLELSLYKKG